MSLIHTLWHDEQGFIVSIEMILISTIAVLGLIVGLSCLSSAIVYEFKDIAFAVSSLNQSFRFPGFQGCKGSFHPGSFYVDQFGLRPYQAGFGYSDIGVGGYGIGGGIAGGGGGYSSGAPGMHLDVPAPKTDECPPGTECPPVENTAPDAGCTDCTPGYPEPVVAPQPDAYSDGYPMLYSPDRMPNKYGY